MDYILKIFNNASNLDVLVSNPQTRDSIFYIVNLVRAILLIQNPILFRNTESGREMTKITRAASNISLLRLVEGVFYEYYNYNDGK
jgi:hypothetical protein